MSDGGIIIVRIVHADRPMGIVQLATVRVSQWSRIPCFSFFPFYSLFSFSLLSYPFPLLFLFPLLFFSPLIPSFLLFPSSLFLPLVLSFSSSPHSTYKIILVYQSNVHNRGWWRGGFRVSGPPLLGNNFLRSCTKCSCVKFFSIVRTFMSVSLTFYEMLMLDPPPPSGSAA